jgi:hypothetical protein
MFIELFQSCMVLTAVKMSMLVFHVVTPCGFVSTYKRFGESYCLHLQSVFPKSCLFVICLTTLFQYLRLYSVDFYSILIRLPSSSEAGETQVKNMATEFCRRTLIVLVGFFNMPQMYYMGPTALLPLRRKACYGFYHP